MEKTLHRFAIDVSDEIARSQAGLECWAALVNGHHKMMHRVKVRITEVDPDGSDGEAKPSRPFADDNGWLEMLDQRGQFSARRGIAAAGA